MKVALFEQALKPSVVEIYTEPGHLKEVIKKYNPQKIIVSAVNKEWLDKEELSEVQLFTYDTAMPVTNAYSKGNKPGLDRLAACNAAVTKYPNSDTLVIDCGTCLTLSFVNAHNQFEGGSIAPGLTMRLKALHTFTSQLPLISADKADNSIDLVGNSTEKSILSGVINGMTAEINGQIDNYKAQKPNINIIICGGDALFFEKRLKHRIFALPELVLVGLNTVLEYNVTQN